MRAFTTKDNAPPKVGVRAGLTTDPRKSSGTTDYRINTDYHGLAEFNALTLRVNRESALVYT